MPAMPIAESSAPIVVGMRQTSRDTRMTTDTEAPAKLPKGTSVTTTGMKTIVRTANRMVSAISFGRLLSVRALDQGDHPIDERLTPLGGDAHDDAVREDLRAPGDRGTVATGLANDGRGLAGDGGLVDRRDAFDDLAVGRNHVVGLADDQVALGEQRRRDELLGPVGTKSTGLGLRAHLAQRVRLGLSSSLGHRLGEVGEEHRQDQPDRDRPREDAGVGDRLDEGDDRADEDDEHHGVLDLDARDPSCGTNRGRPGRGSRGRRDLETWRRRREGPRGSVRR